ncbi:MAG TPA: methyltransferase [Burkholderiales bacterium]|nr:methyltransferase [Burkholderiales bacterium]
MSKSDQPGFWDTRYRDGVTPWDAGGVPPALPAWLATQKRQFRVLIPGCGSAYEVQLFAERGDDVLGIDFSDAAIEAAQRRLGKFAGRVRKTDFFALRGAPFDLVYERTFLCALPRPLWPQWGKHLPTLLRPGGLLAGFFFFDDNERGPPFGISAAALHALLDAHFVLSEDRPIPPAQSVPVLAGRERWQVWERRL